MNTVIFIFMLLIKNQTATVTVSITSSASTISKGAIDGIIIGCVAIVLGAVIAVIFYRHRRGPSSDPQDIEGKKSSKQSETMQSESVEVRCGRLGTDTENRDGQGTETSDSHVKAK